MRSSTPATGGARSAIVECLLIGVLRPQLLAAASPAFRPRILPCFLDVALALNLIYEPKRFLGDFLSAFARHDDDAVSVGDDHVTGTDEHAADRHGTIHRFEFVPARPETAGQSAEPDGHLLLNDLVGISEP